MGSSRGSKGFLKCNTWLSELPLILKYVLIPLIVQLSVPGVSCLPNFLSVMIKNPIN